MRLGGCACSRRVHFAAAVPHRPASDHQSVASGFRQSWPLLQKSPGRHYWDKKKGMSKLAVQDESCSSGISYVRIAAATSRRDVCQIVSVQSSPGEDFLFHHNSEVRQIRDVTSDIAWSPDQQWPPDRFWPCNFAKRFTIRSKMTGISAPFANASITAPETTCVA
jgi:hypothetical protein